MEYRDSRNSTAHDYGEEFAESVLPLLPQFVNDAKALLKKFPMNKLHVPDKYLQTVLAVLEEHVPGAAVWAFGSRVSGDCHAGSDLDLVVIGAAPKNVSRLKAGFQESSIPFLVDVLRWESIPDYFQEEIRQEYVVLK